MVFGHKHGRTQQSYLVGLTLLLLPSSNVLFLAVKASVVGMLVKNDVTSKDTMVSAVFNFNYLTWSKLNCGCFGVQVSARYLAMLYVTYLMLLTIGHGVSWEICKGRRLPLQNTMVLW